MMREHFGRGADGIRLISPGTRFATGEAIRMALAAGADKSGDWNGMHIEPIDPRSKNSAPVVLVYPYGVVVDKSGRRFFDEGGGLVHETWETFSRALHFDVAGREAYAILDRRLYDIPDWQRAVRSEVPPFEAPTLRELAAKIGVDAEGAGRNRRELRRGGERRCGQVRRHALRWTGRFERAQAAEIELGSADHRAAVSRLSADRRHRLHVRRACDRRPRPGAAWRCADPRPLCRGRNHRAFLRHRAQRGVGVARVRVREEGRTGGGGILAWRVSAGPRAALPLNRRRPSDF